MRIEENIRLLEKQMQIDKDFLFAHPEQGLEEKQTSEYIVKRLKEIGYTDIRTDIYATGVLAKLEGKEQGECILFRSEMDAVVMDETGRTKHSCGHHAHMTILLSLAKILSDLLISDISCSRLLLLLLLPCTNCK